MAVAVRHHLVRLLRRGVEADGMVGGLVDAVRLGRIGAVDGAGRGVDEMRDRMVPAAGSGRR
jgi:hypothetical protein